MKTLRWLSLAVLAVVALSLVQVRTLLSQNTGQTPVPSRPETVQQWQNWGLDQIGIDRLWDRGYSGDGITVAVIDTGLDWDDPTSGIHPAFVGTNVIQWLDTSAYFRDGKGIVINPTDPTGDPWFRPYDDPMDYDGHGTHVASIIAASGQDGQTKGVAYESRLVSMKAFYLEPDTPIEGSYPLPPLTPQYDYPFEVPDTADPAGVLDVIVICGSLPSISIEEVFDPTGAPVTYDYQYGPYYAAATNIPIQGGTGASWKARVTAGSP